MSPDPSSASGLDKGSARAGREQLRRPTADGTHPLRLLVVDDEPSICQALALLFTWHGLEVVTALSAADAIRALTETRIDVMLIDLRLRDARGDTVYRIAVERDPTFRERTLFMTGDITVEAERVIAATNCPYLRKPFDITLAVQAIAALVGFSYMGPTSPPPEPSLGSGPQDSPG